MTQERARTNFANLGKDIKEARQAMNMSRREMAEKVNIDPRYLANIENSGSLPSLPIFYELVKLCKLPVEKYFFPDTEDQNSERRKRTYLKLNLCPENYLTIIERALDGAIELSEMPHTK